jgi:hypothetical protein
VADAHVDRRGACADGEPSGGEQGDRADTGLVVALSPGGIDGDPLRLWVGRFEDGVGVVIEDSFGCAVHIDDVQAAVWGEAGEEDDGRCAEPEVHAGEPDGVWVRGRVVDMARAGELREDGVYAGRFFAEHLGLPSELGCSRLDRDRVIDLDVPPRCFGATVAFGQECARFAGSVCRAAVEDIDGCPAEQAGVRGLCFFVRADQGVHDRAGLVPGADGFDSCADVDHAAAFGAGDELGGFPNIGVEEVDLVAAEALGARAADGGL